MKEAIKVIGVVDICLAIEAHKSNDGIEVKCYYLHKKLPNGMVPGLRKDKPQKFKI